MAALHYCYLLPPNEDWMPSSKACYSPAWTCVLSCEPSSVCYDACDFRSSRRHRSLGSVTVRVTSILCITSPEVSGLLASARGGQLLQPVSAFRSMSTSSIRSSMTRSPTFAILPQTLRRVLSIDDPLSVSVRHCHQWRRLPDKASGAVVIPTFDTKGNLRHSRRAVQSLACCRPLSRQVVRQCRK